MWLCVCRFALLSLMKWMKWLNRPILVNFQCSWQMNHYTNHCLSFFLIVSVATNFGGFVQYICCNASQREHSSKHKKVWNLYSPSVNVQKTWWCYCMHLIIDDYRDYHFGFTSRYNLASLLLLSCTCLDASLKLATVAFDVVFCAWVAVYMCWTLCCVLELLTSGFSALHAQKWLLVLQSRTSQISAEGGDSRCSKWTGRDFWC